MIDPEFVARLDRELIEKDIALHARPFHVVMAWMRARGLSADFMAPEIWEPLMAIYRGLYPNGDFSSPSMFIGGVTLRDKMYPARVHLAFGMVRIDLLKCIDVPNSDLEILLRDDPAQVQRAIYSVADLWDFAYGVADLRGQIADADQLWRNARSAIASTARTLEGGQDLDSAVQSACLSAELAMKGALAFLGWSEPQRRGLSHNLAKLADTLITERPVATDDRLRRACATFPDYVQTRYNAHGLSRIQLMALGVRGQFVAADALRRVSDRNIAAQIEADASSPSRGDV